MANHPDPHRLLFVMDSSAITNGANIAPADAVVPPGVLAEFEPGGATHRRLENLLAAGMRVQEPSAEGRRRAQEAARSAGNLSRLSPADIDVIALAVDLGKGGETLSDDHTVLDVLRRLGLAAKPVATGGIQGTLDWGARCTGCGRRFDAVPKAGECPVCGREVRLKPRPSKRKASKKGPT